MITKYRVNWSRDKIDEIEVLRETDASVFLPATGYQAKGKVERREAKISEYACYFNNFAEAKDFCMKAAESSVISARRSLELANARLGNIKGMKGPQT